MADRFNQAQRLQQAWADRRKKVKPKTELEAKIDIGRQHAPRLKSSTPITDLMRPQQTRVMHEAPQTPPRKTTYGHGKGKGQTTVIDLGKNPSRAEQLRGAFEARGGRPSQYKAPKAPKTTAPRLSDAQKQFMKDQNKAPEWKPVDVIKTVDAHQRLSPHVPGDSHNKTTPAYVWKREDNPHLKNRKDTEFKLPNIKHIVGGAIGTGGVLAAGAVLKDQLKPKKGEAVKKRAQLNERQRGILNDTRGAVERAKAPTIKKATEVGLTDIEWNKGTEIKPVKPQVKTWADAGKAGKTVDVSPGNRGRVVNGMRQGKDGRYRPTKVVETTAAPKPKPVTKIETPTPVKQTRVDRIRGFFDPQAEAERQAAERARRAAVVESESAGAEVPEKPGRVARVRRSTSNLITEAREAVAEAGNSVVGIVSPETAQAKREERAAKNATQTEKAVDEQVKQTEQRTKTPKTEKPKTPQTKRQQQKHPQLEALRQAAAKADAVSLSIAGKALNQPAKETPKQIDTAPEGQPQRQGEGAKAQANQELAARSDARRGQQGTALRNAFEVAERADARTLEVAQLRQQLVAEKKEQKRLKKDAKPKKQPKPKTPKVETVEDKFGTTPEEVKAVEQSGQKVKPPTAAKKRENEKKVAEAPKEVQDLVKEVDAAAGAEKMQEDRRYADRRAEGRGRRDLSKRPKQANVAPIGRDAAPGRSSRRRQGSDPRGTGEPAVSKMDAATAEALTAPSEANEAAKIRRQLAREKRKQKKLLQEQGKQPEQKQPKQEETPEQKAERQARQQARDAAKTPAEKATDERSPAPKEEKPKVQTTEEVAEKAKLNKELELELRENQALKQNQAPTTTRGEGRLKLAKAKSAKGFYKKLMKKIRERQNAPQFVEPKHPGERGAFTGDIQALPVGEGTEAQNEAAKKEMEAKQQRDKEIRDAQARKPKDSRYHSRAASLTDVRPLDTSQAGVGSLRPEADLAARTGYSEAEINDLITKIDPVSSGNTPETSVAAAEKEAKETEKESKRRKGKVKKAQGDLVSDLARGDMQNVMMIDRNAEGEFETRILANEDLDRAVEEAREIEQRGGEDRRRITRRDLRERMTIAEVSPYIKELGEERAPAKKETSRRKKQPGGDRRSETKIMQTPIDKPKTSRTAEADLELEDIKFDWENPNERRQDWLMEDWTAAERQEAVDRLNERAAAGSKDAKKTLEMMQKAAIAKENLGRRAGEANAPSIERDLQSRIRELEYTAEGKPREPLSLRVRPGTNIPESAIGSREGRIQEHQEGVERRAQPVTIPDPERRGYNVKIQGEKRVTIPKPGRVRREVGIEDIEFPEQRVGERRAADQQLPRTGSVEYPRGVTPSPEPKLYERPAHWGRAVRDWAGDVASSFRQYRGRGRTIPGSSATELLGETAKAQGRQVVGAKTKAGLGLAGATLGFTLIPGSDAAAQVLREGGSSGEAVGTGLAVAAESLPDVAKGLAKFTALDIAATKAFPAAAEHMARTAGNWLSTRTAQGTAGKEIANAILRQTGGVKTAARMVGGTLVGGLIAPDVVEASRTAADYMALPRQNKAAEVEASRNKAEMERKYGTPERATATRKGWNPETGKPYTTDELYAMADEISGASAEWNKPENKSKQTKELADAKRNKRIKDTVGKYYNKYRDFVHNIF